MSLSEEIIRLTEDWSGDFESRKLLSAEYEDGMIRYKFEGGYELVAAPSLGDPALDLTIGKLYSILSGRPVFSGVFGGIVFPVLVRERGWRNGEGHE